VLEWIGLARSFFVYWRPGRQRALRRLYSELVHEGDLVFDIGAHLGDRSAAFAALGARVVALEPQPHVARWLRRIVGGNARIVVRPEAVGASPGDARMAISARHPTVSTLSDSWRESLARENAGFQGVRWDAAAQVTVVTLDDLIRSYGVPSFCKIDVEGYETEVLAGLSTPIPALSIEFVSGQLDVAAACVRRLRQLGPYRFNAVLGERRRFVLDTWVGPEAMESWLSAGAGGAPSGDVYARIERAEGR
jgi:FkbM family methyltransferase